MCIRDSLDDALEVLQGPGQDVDALAHRQIGFERDALHPHHDDFLVRQGDGLGPRSHKAGHAAGIDVYKRQTQSRLISDQIQRAVDYARENRLDLLGYNEICLLYTSRCV